MAFTYLPMLITLSMTFPWSACDKLGTFWQLSDIHVDPEYSQHGNPAKMCHFQNKSAATPGFYGNYQCDSSWNLVVSVTEAMERIERAPDFILWTGDTVPHVEQTDVRSVYELISNVTRALRNKFPDPVSIIPVLGNHDAFPSNQMPQVTQDNNYYRNILSMGGWSSLLKAEEQAQFLKGGYYARKTSSGLRLLVLNSNLWYSLNNRTRNLSDPNQQLNWLKQQLTDAQQQKYKVYIVAHICPGGFERLEMKWFYEEYNRKYLQIVEMFLPNIIAHFCGHEHTDSFRILSAPDGSPSSMMFLSPALTPWKSTLPGVGANNPSVRLYHYSRTNSKVHNYIQYYMNLTAANSRHDRKSLWNVEYDPVSAYSLKDCSAESFFKLATNLTQNGLMFQRYLQYNTVSYDLKPVCDRHCFLIQTCALLNLHLDSYSQCLSWRRTTPLPHPQFTTDHHHHKRPPLPHYVYYIIGAMGFLIVLLAIIVSCLCARQRRRHGIPFKYGRFVGSIN